MSTKAKILAADIQWNVDRALSNPHDAQALEALHRDSVKLNGHLKIGAVARYDNQELQIAVQKELLKLEKGGHLPRVRIAASGEFDAYSSEKNDVRKFRQVFASPDAPTIVQEFFSEHSTSHIHDN